MGVCLWLALLITQQSPAPAYVREGDRIEQELRGYRDQLETFLLEIRSLISREAPDLLPELSDRPSEPAVYGFQMLPTIIPNPPQPDSPVASFSYSWPITRGYIEGELIKLGRAGENLREIETIALAERRAALVDLVREYRDLVRNQKTIDAYFQYNRFWQRSIAQDRDRFDRMNALYDMLRSGNPESAAVVDQAVGKPAPPRFIRVRRIGADRIVLRIPVYTDIEDDAFVTEVKALIERFWQAEEPGVRYGVELDIRRRKNLGPKPGDHIDLAAHANRFPKDGAVMTTGAPTVVAVPGRYMAFGPGEVSHRTIAHEFGHVLGLRDGYIRGYRDLGESGFEILELTSAFDDIMSAPRQGNVHAIHFKLILEALE